MSPQNRNPNLSIQQSVEKAESWCQTFALEVMVWTRPTTTGFDILDVQRLSTGMVGGLVFSCAFPASAHPGDLITFSFATFSFGLIQKANRLKRFKAGELLHSEYTGSFILNPYLPPWLCSNRRMERLEPALIAVFALFIFDGSRALATFLLLCALASAIYEAAVKRRDFARRRTLMNAAMESEMASRVMEGYVQSHSHLQQPDTDSPILPTGAAQDTLNLQRKNRATSKTNWFNKLKK